MFSYANLRATAAHYFTGALLYGLGVYIYLTNGYYASYLSETTKEIIVGVYAAYLLVAPFVFFFDSKKNIHEHKPAIIFWMIMKVFRCVRGLLFRSGGMRLPKLNHKEKTALLFVFVKLFYVPLMLNFLVGNYNSIMAKKGDIFLLDSLGAVTYSGYALMLALIFFVDVLFFAFGYLFEAKFLKNKVRSVEPTFLGWAVALVCYPPFNGMFTGYVGWSANDYVVFSSLNATFAARSVIVLLLLVYLWATISLGTKCSNLTNRGIVCRGAYRYVRHPAYVSKSLAWWITVIPVMSVSAFGAMLVWSFVYYLRAVTEERHLSKDPDYREYCKKTKYMFVPYVW